MKPGRAEDIARAVALGESREQYVTDDEEGAFWDAVMAQSNLIRESGGVIDIPSDYNEHDDDYLAHLYSDDGDDGGSGPDDGGEPAPPSDAPDGLGSLIETLAAEDFDFAGYVADDPVAGLRAAAAPIDPDAPPVNHFVDPQFSEPTAMQIDDDGHIYGHLALWGTCHTTHTARSKCITPPHSRTGYGHFLTGQVLTREGRRVPVGVITLDTGHASEQFSMTRAVSHYDNTGTAVADISVGEDKHGIWFSGSLRPGLTAKQVRALRASPLSGDWRERTATRGDLELVAALAVNVQGFPVPRPKGLVASGAMSTLVAAGMLPPKRVRREDVQSGALSADDIRYLKSLAAREQQREQDHRRAVLSDATSLKRDMVLSEAQNVARQVKRDAITEMAASIVKVGQ
jgi:hypothetical protein